ncbi:MAG: peptidoglycan-associated lipoprotein Pal [Vicinamibacterales bacterium]
MMRMGWKQVVGAAVVVAMVAAGCGKKPAPVERPMPPPATGTEMGETPAPPPPPAPIDEPPVVPPPPPADAIGSKDLDALNRESPLAPVFFALDSFELSADGRAVLQASAQVLRQQPTWQVTVEGHCDERGTAEYNLSLGERRAIAAKTYLVSLGIAAERLRTVSYGKEFPFDPGHDESAWSRNRRAHFVITAK